MNRGPARYSSARLLIFAVAALSLLTFLALPAFAHAETWMSAYPYGIIRSQPSIVGVDVFGTAPLNARTAALTIDGVKQKTFLTQGTALGHWISNETLVGGVWQIHWTWAPDTGGATKGTLYCYPTTLADGVHTVTGTVKDTNGVTLTCTPWSFTVAQAPSISAASPAADTTVTTLSPAISAKVTDNVGVSGVSATVNGAPASTSYVGTTVTVSGYGALSYGPVTVAVTASDAAGNSATKSWTFRVAMSNEVCADCHDTGYATDNAMGPNCTYCHPDRAAPHGYNPEEHTATLGSGVVGLFSDHEYVGAVSYLVNCADCHNDELGPEHASLCARCHPVPRDSFVSWTGSCTQAQCHPTYHGDTVSIHDAAASGNCGVCHDETDFDLLADPCFGCHRQYTPADTVAPVTTSNARATYNGAAVVQFSVADEGKIGCATTFYALDGPAVSIGDSVVVDTPGSHILEFWSVDQNGNEERPHQSVSFTTTTDTAPPLTQSNVKAAYEGPVAIALQATDSSDMGVKGTYYRLNGGPVVAGTYISIAPPATGMLTYTLSYWSDDYAGNAESPHTTTFTVTRDVTPPVTTSSLVNGAAYIGAVTVTLTASDGNGTGVAETWYRLDTGAWTKGTSTVVPAPSSGTVGHTLSWYSRDAAGNQEGTKSASFTVSAGASPSAPTVTPMPDMSFDYDSEPPPTLTMQWSPVIAPDGDPCTYRIEHISQYPYSGPLNWASASVINVSSNSYTTQFWGGFHYWRVTAIDSVHTGLVSSPSAVDAFTVFDGYGPYY